MLFSRSYLRKGRFRVGAASLGILAALACFAVTASAATAAQWTVNKSPLSGSASYGAKAGGSISLSTHMSGTQVELAATGVECVECKITNQGSPAAAVGTGKLKLTGITFRTPAACAVPGGTVTTNPLAMSLFTVKGKAYESVRPETGESLFTLNVQKGSGACPISGSYPIRGSLVMRAGGIGTEQATHEMTLSAAIETEGGGALRWGVEPAWFTGSIIESLTGALTGQSWGADVIEEKEPPVEPEEHLRSPPQWTVNKSPLSGSASYGAKAGGSISLSTHMSGTQVELAATGVECVECKITNQGSPAAAVGTGKLKLTGITFRTPAACAVPGGTVTTNPLAMSLFTVKGKAYESVRPETGESLFTLNVQKGSGACPISGSYPIRGSLVMRAGGIGTEQATHEMTLSAAIETEGGGALRWGVEPAWFTGSIIESLTGALTGQSWGAE